MNVFIKKTPPYQGEGDNVLKAIPAGPVAGLDNMAHMLTLGDTMVFGPAVVNSIRFAYNDTTLRRLQHTALRSG